MNILRVVSDLYPFVVGGIGIHAHQMSRGQALRGNEVTVVTLRPDHHYCDEQDPGYTIIQVPVWFSLKGNSFAPRVFIEILKREKKADIIHTHSHLFFSTNLCVLIRIFSSVPLIITNHGLVSASAPAWLNRIYKSTISRLSFSVADHIICYTEMEKDEIVKMGIDSRKISVIHNGVDTSLFVPRPQDRGGGKFQVLWVGRYVPGKDVKTLIEAFALLQKKKPDIHLVLVGEGPEKSRIETLIRKYNLESSVTLIDYIDNTDLPKIYNQSNLFVLPSLMEGVPRTILEAMACGVPVISTNLPHLAAIINGAGICIPPKEPSALADAMSFVLENGSLAEGMGERGRALIMNGYSWEDTVQKTLDLYERVISNSP